MDGWRWPRVGARQALPCTALVMESWNPWQKHPELKKGKEDKLQAPSACHGTHGCIQDNTAQHNTTQQR